MRPSTPSCGNTAGTGRPEDDCGRHKTDILADRTLLDKLKAHVEAQGLRFFELSAAATWGVRELMKAAAGELAPPAAGDYL